MLGGSLSSYAKSMRKKCGAFLILWVLLGLGTISFLRADEAQEPEFSFLAVLKERKIIRGAGYGDAWALELELRNTSKETLTLDPFNIILFYITDADKYDALGGSSGLVLAFARPFPPVLADYPVSSIKSAQDLDALRQAPSSPNFRHLTLGPQESRRFTLLFNLLKKGIDTDHLDLSYLAYSSTGDPNRAIFLTTLDRR